MFNIDLLEEVNLKGFIMIVPAVSVGNVAQLAVDLILERLKPRKVGTLYTNAILPLAGAAEGGDLVLSAERDDSKPQEEKEASPVDTPLFHSLDFKLVILQIRSPILQDAANQFTSDLVDWCLGKGIDKILLLASLHHKLRDDHEMHGPPLKYYVSPQFHKESGLVNRHEDENGSGIDPFVLDPLETPIGFSLYGGGMAMNMYKTCFTKSMPVMAIVSHCSEGDNVPEAMDIATAVNKFMHLAPPNHIWQFPSSWKHLFGSPFEGSY